MEKKEKSCTALLNANRIGGGDIPPCVGVKTGALPEVHKPLLAENSDTVVSTRSVNPSTRTNEINNNKTIEKMQHWGKRYPHAGYGARFVWWLSAEHPEPYGSFGNGSAMRVSSAAWLFDNLETVRRMARLSA